MACREMNEKRDIVVLITRKRTDNVGNQALSVAILYLLKKAFPAYKVIMLERHPDILENLVLSSFTASAAALEEFQDFAVRLADQGVTRRGRLQLRESTPDEVLLAKRDKSFGGRIVRRVGRYLPSVRRAIVLAEYRRRLVLYQRAVLVVANPAGEFDPASPPDMPARLLLDLEVARLSGAKTAVVNHSLEIVDDRLRDLVSLLYPRFNFIAVRDPYSRRTLVDLGVDPARCEVAPDAVLSMCNIPIRDEGTTGPARRKVAVALNPRCLRMNDEVADRIISELTSRFEEVHLVSNCWKVDNLLARLLATRRKVTLQKTPLAYTEYLEYLSQFDLVVSARLHTAIFALILGIPVLPLETQHFRLAGVMEEIRYPIETIHLAEDGWISAFIQAVEKIRNMDGRMTDCLSEVVSSQRRRVHDVFRRMAEQIRKNEGAQLTPFESRVNTTP
jgi:polysaccharide pyruvyl transferase WcaK-like protein